MVAPIPLTPNPIHTDTEIFHMVGRFFGGGMTAGRLHGELEPVIDGNTLEPIRSCLTKAGSYTTGDLVTEINAIQKDLGEAYQGAATTGMGAQFSTVTSSAQQLGPMFDSLARYVNQTQETLNTAWQTVKGYSRLHADASNAKSLIGGDSDDDKAESAWNSAKSGLSSAGNGAQAVSGSGGSMQSPVSDWTPHPTNPPADIPNPGATGPGPGSFGPGPGPGPGHYGPGPGPGHYGPGPGPGGYGPGSGPGGYGPGGYGPGGFGPGHGFGPGSGGPGFGPGAGLDTGSDLSSAGPGGPGPGFGGPGDGSAGLSGSGGPGAGGGDAAGEAGAGGRGGVSGLPLGGRGGAGGGGDSDRERSTWLSEDDDIWGESDAPDGVIS